MHDEDEHEHDDAPVVRPWSWMQFAAVAANLMANLGQTAFAFFDDIKDAAKADVAWRDEKRAAWRSLHRDLETIDAVEK